ncbi:MAG: hypothetical protein P0Y64_05640 [Candidatus Sphingomonas colombiensis]|nr:hypothetical protein [Sphingomonas sp.]WEK44291.1 MAG: hypothetical protein P0Y64_05640 [Sphingomonas sp.]
MIDEPPPPPRPEVSGSDTLKTFLHLDLLAAAYQWDEVAVMLVTSILPEALQAMRIHQIETPASLKALVEGLWDLHFELWFSQTVTPSGYSAWWMRPWAIDSPIGDRDPFSAVSDTPTESIAAIVGHYRAMRSGAYM